MDSSELGEVRISKAFEDPVGFPRESEECSNESRDPISRLVGADDMGVEWLRTSHLWTH